MLAVEHRLVRYAHDRAEIGEGVGHKGASDWKRLSLVLDLAFYLT
jgi:hypothetical protein